jgi:FkbM family methyltransferase
MPSITQLLPRAGKQAKKISGPILIYGAGNAGRGVCRFLEQQDFEILCFIDRLYSKSQPILGKDVLSIEQAHTKYGGDVEVLVAIHNYGVDMPPLLATLGSAGFNCIFTMFDFVNQFPKDSTFRFFLSEGSSIAGEGEPAEAFFELLEDERSQKIYSELIKFRVTGDYQHCPLPDLGDQYAPKDIPSWNPSLRLIDCGAYDGDSMRMLEKHGYQIESILAFEPDLTNYKVLIENIQDQHGIFLPCGVSSSAKTVQFSVGNGQSSRAVDKGGISVQMLSIDEAFPKWAPNLIKLDIEGGENEALLGIKKTLDKYRPGLAISAYHLPCDLWQLGILIHEMQLDYRFYMRSHGYSSFDTVLYALPR